MRRWKIALPVLFMLGCASDSAREGESASTSGDDSIEHARAEPAVAAVTLPSGPVGPVGPPQGEHVEGDFAAEEMEVEVADVGESRADGELEGLAAAMAAAQNASGATPCEHAYNGAMAMIAAPSQQSGQAPSTNVPSRSSFLGGCNGLSVHAQRCMTMSYAMANQASCSAAMQSAEVQAFRNQMRRP